MERFVIKRSVTEISVMEKRSNYLLYQFSDIHSGCFVASFSRIIIIFSCKILQFFDTSEKTRKTFKNGQLVECLVSNWSNSVNFN